MTAIDGERCDLEDGGDVESGPVGDGVAHQIDAGEIGLAGAAAGIDGLGDDDDDLCSGRPDAHCG